MENQLSITLRIGERVYPMKIYPQEEALIRNAEGLIRERIEHFKAKYPERDMHDWLVLTALHLSRNFLYQEEQCNITELTEKLSLIDQKLNDIIEDNEITSLSVD